MYVSQFDANGVFISNLGDKDYSKQIGKDSPYTIFFSKEGTSHTNDRPHNHVKETYDYELPLEIPSNKDFLRGDLVDETDPLSPLYMIDNWRFYKEIPATTQDNTAYIRRMFNSYREEIERYVVIGIAADSYYYIESEPIRIGDLDKFDFSIDYRRSGDVVSSGDNRISVAQIRLYSNNGTFWTLHGGTSIANDVPKWVESSSDWTVDNKYFVLEFNGDINEQDWQTVSFFNNMPCPPIPFGLSGYITIVLVANTLVDSLETHFSNLRWDYIPYINGSYSKYQAQTNTVTRGEQPSRYKARRDRTVSMSDSPRPLFKGAMFKLEVPEALDDRGLIFTDNTDFFAADSRINLPGDRTDVLFAGQNVQIKGSTSNDGVVHIISVIYDSGSNTTDVFVSDVLIDEDNASAIWYVSRFVLCSTSLVESPYFYDASLYPDGTGMVIRPYGELQVYDVYNQFKSENKVFQGQMQGLDVAVTDVESLPGLAHLLYMWYFRDVNENTDNRVFLLLTFSQTLRTCDWKGTFREVGNSTRAKTYIGNIFKYISR